MNQQILKKNQLRISGKKIKYFYNIELHDRHKYMSN